MLCLRLATVPRVDQLNAGIGKIRGIPGYEFCLVLVADGCNLCIEGANRSAGVFAASHDVCIVGRGVDIEGKDEACEGFGEQGLHPQSNFPFPAAVGQKGDTGSHFGRSERRDHQS